MLSPDKILLMTGRVRSLDLLPRSVSFSRELSDERRLRDDEVVSVKPLLEGLSDKSAEKSDPFESTSNSDFGEISSGLSCFFSLEKMDTYPSSVSIGYVDVYKYRTTKSMKTQAESVDGRFKKH